MKTLVLLVFSILLLGATSCKSTKAVAPAQRQSTTASPSKTSSTTLESNKALKTSGTSSKVGTVMKGGASYYADKYEGRPTASGEAFSQKKLTAAHKTLKFGTMVRVTNLSNNKKVDVKINDRGPYVNGRIIDLSRAAAEKIDLIRAGVAQVTVEILSEP